MATLALSVGMRAEETVTLEQVAKQLNSECPVKGEDFTLDNVWLIGNRLEYHMSMSYPCSQNLAIEKKNETEAIRASVGFRDRSLYESLFANDCRRGLQFRFMDT